MKYVLLLAALTGCTSAASQAQLRQGTIFFRVEGVTVYTFTARDGNDCYIVVGEVSGYAIGKNVAVTCA